MVGSEERALTGTAIDDPRPRGERQQVVIDRVEAVGPGWSDTAALAGRVLLWLPRSAVVEAGDRLRVTSSLEEPEDFDGFAYRAYLARQGVAAIATQPRGQRGRPRAGARRRRAARRRAHGCSPA